MERLQRNLDRIMEIQFEVEDIMRNNQYNIYHHIFSLILDQCSDELEALITDEGGDELIVERVRTRIDDIYGSKDFDSINIFLNQFVRHRLVYLDKSFSHRKIDIISRLELVPAIRLPVYVLEKAIDGLIKNAVENTPDGGKIEVIVRKKGSDALLIVSDYGVGIAEKYKKRIFEGFFAIQDTLAYSSRQPFDFNAGGKGADLLRMKIFSEQYDFKIDMNSSRCKYIPQTGDVCPGKIKECSDCTKPEDCYSSGGTNFSIHFQPASLVQ
jgi:light-regulated signal transduction histidine kinase (bacteriophytochrome)